MRVMPLSRSLQHTTAAGAGWHSNGMKGCYFLGEETETEIATLLGRLEKRGKVGKIERTVLTEIKNERWSCRIEAWGGGADKHGDWQR